jgi:hypothetical protein
MSRIDRLALKERDRLRRIEAWERHKAEEAEVQSGIDETVGLAISRGEQVESAKGKVRIRSRDGLRFLFDGGQLDQSEFEAGLFYRLCYETLESSPRSNLNRDIRGANGAFAETRAFRAMRLSEMETIAKPGRQATTLRLIAGQGRAVRAISSGGADFHLNVKALKVVLGEIADRYKLRFAA